MTPPQLGRQLASSPHPRRRHSAAASFSVLSPATASFVGHGTAQHGTRVTVAVVAGHHTRLRHCTRSELDGPV
ncbi:hypothetical protein E2C01_010775 [Portunus trituberculatus]|uniref:Uncharacterized protein n=1 Tax=Portunus trituberculatus TaxID=210409 RepID=A0A5B7D9R9_PORTR|nr:hypothetical protein [Portunus trituberculatus]